VTEHVQRQFQTEDPIELRVEIGAGEVVLTATETSQTSIEITGRGAEELEIEQVGRVVSIISPPRRVIGFARDRALDVRVSLPTDSTVTTKLGSADLVVHGRISGCDL
jgi:hypothetical protein